MPAVFEPPLSARLRDAEHVLVASAGGGFDVYAGLPLALALRNAGTRVTLARWLAAQGHDATVYAFERTGVRPLRAAYRKLVDLLGIDAVVLADGGTDILMRGDEAGLGTPEEDMASLAAVAGLPVPQKLVVSLGFGIDSHRGICHAHVLENLAALQRDGAFLGALSIPPGSAEAAAYCDAVAHAAAYCDAVAHAAAYCDAVAHA
ncbi:DUF1152 domain-containing protein, partial [Catellatospora chokoriensis]